MVVTGVPPIVLGISTLLSKQAMLLFLIRFRSANRYLLIVPVAELKSKHCSLSVPVSV